MEQNIYRALGIVVRSHRIKHGWSQEELGERASLHPSYIGQIERGTKKISLVTLQKLAKALRARISDLLQEKPFEYKKSTWETKIQGIISDRPVDQQKRAYKILKEILISHSHRKTH